MPQMPRGPHLSPPARAMMLVFALGLSAASTGCADVHPGSDDSDTGMLESSHDEQQRQREGEERAEEHEQEGEHRQ